MNDSPEQVKIAQTHVLQPGDRIAFQVIPPAQEQVVDMYYYEQVAGATYVTPQGQTVWLNAQGDIGQPPKTYFCFTQDSARNLYLYGALRPQPGKALDLAVQEWIVKPETGKVLLYPGQYHAGLEWATTFEMQSQGETVAVLDVTYKVERLETVAIDEQEYEAFKVVGRERNGATESITWFSTQLGINIKKLSYSTLRPGYELWEHNLGDAR
jgi:hypothetical protein